MTQKEQLLFLIQYLLEENSEYHYIQIPHLEAEQKQLLRSLMNMRLPKPIAKEFLKIQDDYLTEQKNEKGVVLLSDLSPIKKGIYLWQGDITRLQVDAIVNAANCTLLGCFVPCHKCIDNAIHSASGIQLRLACYQIMKKQEKEEVIGTAKITKAYNLPCQYILHTVGPIIDGKLTEKDCQLLASCYQSCLNLAAFYRLKSIAFCCISTGEFHFPNEIAARIAIETIEKYQKENQSNIEVIFNVFKKTDYEIYKRFFSTN